MTTTHLGLDEEGKEKWVYEARGGKIEGGGDHTRAGGARRGRRMVWGATCVRMAVACAHARPIVARYIGGLVSKK